MKDTLIVIPARYASTRLPGKMLEKIEGKTIIQWVWEACQKSRRRRSFYSNRKPYNC